MNKKLFKKLIRKHIAIINWIIIAVGAITILSAYIPALKNPHPVITSILLSIGGSIMATGIVTIITSAYMVSNDEKDEIISQWQLNNIYATKSVMNQESNQHLEFARKQIDIVAIGMTNFLQVKGSLLEELLKKGVKIRIISCNNKQMLAQREKDESTSHSSLGVMEMQVQALTNWVDKLSKTGLPIEIRYHSTYPGFSYLRIDKHIFWGPNLPMYNSQQNMAFEFSSAGDGGQFLIDYFDKLWKDDCCSELNL